MNTTIAGRVLSACLTMAAVPQASAAVQYTWVQSGSGDTSGIAGLNDRGDLLLNGYGNSCLGGQSAYRIYDAAARDYGPHIFISGLDRGIAAPPNDCGVQVHARNSAGDMLGTSTVDNQLIPTYWTGGAAYNLNDAANAGLLGAFTPDPFAANVYGISLRALEILDPHPYMRYRDDFYLVARFVNGVGMYAAESSYYSNIGFVLIPLAAVPEPGSWSLAGIALLALVFSRPSSKLVNAR